MRPECTSPRLPGPSRQPQSREPLRAHLQRIRGSNVGRTQGPLSPAALVIRLRWNSALGVSTGVAMRIATVWPDATASRAYRIVAARKALPLAGPAGCPRAGDRRLCRRHLRDLEAVRGVHNTECCRALQTAAAGMAAVQAAQRTMAGRSRSRFRSRGGATPTKSFLLCAFFHVSPAADGGTGPPRRRCSRRAALPECEGRCAEGKASGDRSCSNRQCHQPFELADFPAETAYARSVRRLQPHGGSEVAVPCRPFPALARRSRSGPGMCTHGRCLAGGDHPGLKRDQPCTAAGDLLVQYLPAEPCWPR
jgi:hypothetical protein